jgi:hypothetical protein
MASPLLTAGIGAIGALGSSIFGNIGAKKRQQAADAQNIKFWKMQNAYNTPAKQMERLQQAGLNPNLIYGSGQANTGVAGSISASKPAPYNIQNPVPSALNGALIQSQIDVNNSNRIKNLANAAQSKSSKEQIDALIGGKVKALEISNAINEVKKQVTQSTTQSQINKLVADADTSAFTAELRQIDAQYAQGGFPKGNTIGVIFNSLGLSPNNPEDRKIIKGLIYTLYGSKVLDNLSGPLSKILKSFLKN